MSSYMHTNSSNKDHNNDTFKMSTVALTTHYKNVNRELTIFLTVIAVVYDSQYVSNIWPAKLCSKFIPLDISIVNICPNTVINLFNK